MTKSVYIIFYPVGVMNIKEIFGEGEKKDFKNIRKQ